ncbi:uncharacterized membrane protein YciS (DUF1049 family) [Clostridium beijerinckii]|uniref:hypothetical protein n=1 Tax=Clostridium beijerinckii TaxID=1520 RepID=UPI0014941F92|nr:hypothetical protein [Clostridium beijerinckii]NOW86748.1 uncharacterized membrane protein YciS (DUF1049 family) [Clostridium beijerinckii]
MVNAFLEFEQRLAADYGYKFVVYFEDLIVLIAGILIGMIIMAFMSGRVVFKLTKVKSLGSQKLKLVGFKHEGVKQYVAAPKNISESVETLLLVLFRPLTQYKQYTYRDERRTKTLLILLALLTIVLICLALLCTFTVVIDNIK